LEGEEGKDGEGRGGEGRGGEGRRGERREERGTHSSLKDILCG
jgi:hypothetical protein